MALPVLDPNECIDQVIADATTWLSTGTVPNLLEAAGHGATLLGALLHNHGVGSAMDDAKLVELAAALQVTPDEGVGGPVANMLVQALIAKFGPLVAEWIIKLIQDRT